jgi:protease I
MKIGTIIGNHGYKIDADIPIKDVNPTDYNILMITVGKGPEQPRLDKDVLEITIYFFKENKPVAAIYHVHRF